MHCPETRTDPEAFSRLDESDDAHYYATERLVYHLDARARQTVERIIGTLAIEPRPAILDLMANFDSHVPESLQTSEMIGLGLNEQELAGNQRLDRFVIHDLNRDPTLPFADASFDIVLNTVSVDYMTRPFDVFGEVGRILVPGGLFLVIVSNRLFKQKAVKIWRQSDETTRLLLIEDFFGSVPDFGRPRFFESRGKPRPRDDKYAGLGIPSDPIFAIYAERSGAAESRGARPEIPPEPSACPPPEVVAERKARVRDTLRCPYCDQPLQKFEIPASPFCEWPNEYMYVCFENDCPYLLEGWDTMAEQGNQGYSYRLMYNPDLDRCMPTPLTNTAAGREKKFVPRG